MDLPCRPKTLLAYELPDPLKLRVEVTEDTGARIHQTLRKASQSRTVLINLFRYSITDPGTPLRIESGQIHLSTLSVYAN